jgi:hypothetical protein
MDSVDQLLYHKMKFIMNALEDGWKVNKKDNVYIFTKKHEQKREVFEEKYLENFVKKHMNENKN